MAKRITAPVTTRTLALTTGDSFLTVFRLRTLGYHCTYPGVGEAFSLWREDGATVVVRMRGQDGMFAIHAQANETALSEIVASVEGASAAA